GRAGRPTLGAGILVELLLVALLSGDAVLFAVGALLQIVASVAHRSLLPHSAPLPGARANGRGPLPIQTSLRTKVLLAVCAPTVAGVVLAAVCARAERDFVFSAGGAALVLSLLVGLIAARDIARPAERLV